MPGNSSIAASAAAAARNGLTAMNWAIADPTWKTGSATATAVTPVSVGIVGMYMKGAAIVKAKVVVGSDPSHLLQIDSGRTLAAPGPLNSSIVPMGFPVVAQDTLNVYVDNGNNSEIDNVVLFIQRPDVKGANRGQYKKLWVLRGTSSTADVAHTWGSKVITWDNALANPKGRYHILGMSWHSTLGVCARVYTPANPNLRPTVLQGVSTLTDEMQKFDDGSLIEFQGDELSSLTFEALGQSTSSDHVINILIGEM